LNHGGTVQSTFTSEMIFHVASGENAWCALMIPIHPHRTMWTTTSRKNTTRPLMRLSRWFALLTCIALWGCTPTAGPETAAQSGSALDVSTPPQKPNPGTAAPRPNTTEEASTCPPRFVDRAAERQLRHTFFTDTVPGRYFLPEIMCGGLAWLDFDLDGSRDLYLTNGTLLKTPKPDDSSHRHQFYRNQLGQGFQNITEQTRLGHNGYGQGTAVGDFNQDGFPDLFVSCYGANRLYANCGDGTFEDVTASLGERPPLWSTGSVFADFDADGDLDLFVANYMHVNWETHKSCTFGGKPGYCGPGDYESQPDWLFINDGTGRFEERAAEFGFVGDRGNGLSVAWADLDDDRLPELYVANDMAPNFLFSRTGAGSAGPLYLDVAGRAGCAVSGNGQNEASMGIALADYDQDGLPDLYLTHYYHHKNTLYHNLGQMLFEDDSYRTRVAALSKERLGFGCLALDYDRDGAMDLFVANGHVLGPEHDPFQMQPTLIRNDGRGRFDDVSRLAGEYFQQSMLGRAVGGADFDNDGDVDLAVTHLDRPVALLCNETETGRRWIGLQLQTEDRIRPVGTRVELIQGNQTQVRPLWEGGSYYSTSDDRILLGIPTAGPFQIRIHWPDGQTTDHSDLEPNRYWVIQPGRNPRMWSEEQER
jgi:hypothetical protein